MREIKFRCYTEQDAFMYQPLALEVIAQLGHYFSDNIKLMQYTGLKDKNSVEIYEGDIVNHHGFLGYVKYINRGNCNVLGYALACLISGRIFHMYCDEVDNYEVIGNIYENPELLPTN